MPSNKPSNASRVPKNSIRYAFVIAAAVSTLVGAQLIAFSEDLLLRQNENQQATTHVTAIRMSTPSSFPFPIEPTQTAVPPTLRPSPTVVALQRAKE